MSKILVISPHVDDETLGAGGYILKRRNLGDEIYWLNVTNAKKEYGYTDEEVLYWSKITSLVAEKLGVIDFFDLKLEPSGLDKINKSVLIGKIKECFDKISPNIVIVPFYNDIHSDHGIVFEAAMACGKSFRCPSIEKILCMEIISETDYSIPDVGFVPNYFVDISDYIDKKIEILNLYESEIKTSPFPRNIEAIKGLAKYRGATCYANYAEAFRLIKCVER